MTLRMLYVSKYYYDPTRSIVLEMGHSAYWVLPDDVQTSLPVSMADSPKFYWNVVTHSYWRKGRQFLGGGSAPSPFEIK